MSAKRFRLKISTWTEQQLRLLRRLASKSWRASVVVTSLAIFCAVAVSAGVVPEWLGLIVPMAITVSPLVVLLIWVLHVPTVWPIHPGWLGLCGVVLSAVWAILGHWYAAVLINAVFAESPAYFPVARMMGTFMGGFIISLGFYAVTASAVTIFGGPPAVLMAIWMIPDWRRSLTCLLTLVGIAASGGFSKGAIAPIEDRAQSYVRTVALNADFYPAHRCDATDWPAGITRVAFVGDAQVLGWRQLDDTLHVLGCTRSK